MVVGWNRARAQAPAPPAVDFSSQESRARADHGSSEQEQARMAPEHTGLRPKRSLRLAVHRQAPRLGEQIDREGSRGNLGGNADVP